MAFGIESDEGVMSVYKDLQSSEEQEDKQALQRLERHMSQARALVKTYVTLESETKSDDELLQSLKASVAGSQSGDPEKKTHILIWYNQCDAGEATAQPHLRTPALRNRGSHLQRFVKLVQQRKDPSQSLCADDVYALCDAGKEGNKNLLLGSFTYAPEADPATGRLQKAQQCKKHVRCLTAIISEGSITDRLAKIRGFSSINQIQKVYLVTKDGLNLNQHERLHTEGSSNRGNFIGPFAWDDSDRVEQTSFAKLRQFEPFDDG